MNGRLPRRRAPAAVTTTVSVTRTAAFSDAPRGVMPGFITMTWPSSNVVPIADAKHDVFLSLAEPRAVAYRELAGWLDSYIEHLNRESPASAGHG